MAEPRRAEFGAELRRELTDDQVRAAQEWHDGDTPAAALAEVRALQSEARKRVYGACLPDRYRDASYGDLDAAEQAREQIRGWLSTSSQTLMLVGPPGTGKTHAGYAVLNDVVASGGWAYGCSTFDLFSALRPDARPSAAPRMAVQADVFLFDDLAAERSTDWVVEQFGGIVDDRYSSRRRQIVTTNAAYEDLETKYGQRTMSRLMEGVTVAQFTCRDRRREVRW